MYWNMNEDVGDDFCKMQLKQNVRTEGLGSKQQLELWAYRTKSSVVLSTVTVTSNTRAVSHFQVAAHAVPRMGQLQLGP